jgi:uncharacterized membrane protein
MFGTPCVDWFGCSIRIAADVWNSLEAFKDYSNDFLMIVSYADSQGMLACTVRASLIEAARECMLIIALLQKQRRYLMFDLAALHPLIVHAPLVLIPVAIVFQLLHLLVPKAGLRIAAILMLDGGVGGAILATETAESAEHRTDQVSPGAEDISVSGFVPQTMAEGNLLETHAKLGELTRNLYGFLLLVEAGLLATTLPALARFRRDWSLSAGVARIVRGTWMLVAIAGLAVVVLTGHYGGTLVYEHGVGIPKQAAVQAGEVQSGAAPDILVAPTTVKDADE